jgi:hypothetical protein
MVLAPILQLIIITFMSCATELRVIFLLIIPIAIVNYCDHFLINLFGKLFIIFEQLFFFHLCDINVKTFF